MHSTPTSANYDFWIEQKLNVLFTGKHGIGKTETVKEKFQEHFGEKWLYFSASTMDPWVDFVGVPKEILDPITGQTYLELIRPKVFQNDEVEAIMIDEFNRGEKKVKNAVMELLQFKSINGKKFNNLKIIWAAINPDDNDAYDVERMDPAQKDRFQIHIDLPYAVSYEYFTKKYNHKGKTACSWWDRQDDELKNEISPRRLSYAMDVFNAGGDLSHVLPVGANIEELVTQLSEGSYIEQLRVLFLNKDDKATKEAFESDNFWHGTDKAIMENVKYMEYFVPLYPKEKLIKTYIETDKVRQYFINNLDYRNYQTIFDPIIARKDKNTDNGDKPMQFSIISGLTRWREKTIPVSMVSDIDFINIVSDTRYNIEYLTQPEKQKDVINKFGLILSQDAILPEEFYTKMFGVMCELLNRTEESLHTFVLKNINSIKDVRIKQGYAPLTDIYTEKLPGLRRVGSSSTIFEEVKAKLTKEGVFKYAHS
jgi:hypothetical protein